MLTFWATDDQPTDTVRSLKRETVAGPVTISTRGDEISGYLLERRHVHPKGHLSVQRVPVANALELRGFVDNDPLMGAAAPVYEEVLDDLARYRDKFRDTVTYEPQITSEISMLLDIARTCEQLGFVACGYHVILLDRSGRHVEIHDAFVAGASAWAQRYSQVAPFQNDPAISQAMRHQLTPVRHIDVISTRPEHLLNQLSVLTDCESHVFFPTRHQNAIAVLHVAAPPGRPGVEKAILDQRATLQMAAHDLLLQYTGRRYAAWKARLHLSPAAEKVLEKHCAGMKSTEIEQVLGVTNREYRKLCREINGKLGFNDMRSNVALMTEWMGYRSL
ncbi:hypothetical protein ABEG10_38125 (plasmid) [Burkholderia cenocepacia]|uniref:hypothetical protein n=1 Tax=Burkholderia cenocepacia TaxID=95486 RepID=UPI0020A1B833|nr:hypothetical protein [Burkholderia cenocepacia]MCO8402794.1 hypothetical protein [Burkholderia cenocepacia]MCO8415033.1 hypothetical protein [Burkholderia cenocepacia]MCO8423071.1 hypothetical protein [Burkholderia cenocepacia]MCO8474780.1 hypothetical protein [Burkholderia cenocepacia]MCO8482040.1 hypothetical protein [Burkholderia cenocepacia]